MLYVPSRHLGDAAGIGRSGKTDARNQNHGWLGKAARSAYAGMPHLAREWP
jgi:hypothetical protein